ncbi:MAG: cytochrome c biogenesis protein, partial [Opitutaceae bacterium]
MNSPVPAADPPPPDAKAARPRRFAAFAQKWLPAAVLVVALAALASTFIVPAPTGPFDLAGFGRLPVLADGRLKPLDTVARSTLLQIQNRQDITLDDAQGLPPIKERLLPPDEWLLDVFYRPEKAASYRTFVIDNPDLLTLIGQTDQSVAIHYPDLGRQVLATFDFMPSRRRRFSYRELAPYLAEIADQAKLAQPVDAQGRTPFQRAVIQLEGSIVLYQDLEHAMQVPGAKDFLGELMRFQAALPQGIAAVRAQEAGKPHSEADVHTMLRLGERYSALAGATHLLAIPPPPGDSNLGDWRSVGQAIMGAFHSGEVDPAALAYAGMGDFWRNNQPGKFNKMVELYQRALQSELGGRIRKIDAEVRFNLAQPFYSAMLLYLVGFFAAILSWLVWPEALRRSALTLLALAWAITTAGILTRMWLGGRPPVTNLYSSALFIGWGSVGLCLILEAAYKNAMGIVAGGLIGFGTLVIAHHLSLSGDTLEMMRAVLDSNFWLSTHVVVVTTGYASTFLAGFLALIYIVLGVFTPWLKRDFSRGAGRASRTETNADALTRMVYGIVCFATLFSFVGTV